MMDLAQTLKWYDEMGVDEVIASSPINHFIAKKKTESSNLSVNNNIPASAPAPVAKPTASLVLQNPASITLDTAKIAQSCNTLAELRDAVNSFKALGITRTATNTVFADGVAESEIMLIGEAPGAEEDAQGIPFCGASGKMLDQMLSYIGLTRQKNFYITNTIFWRPPGNRRPTPEEIAICKPFVEKHIALIKPRLVILVGGTAIASVLDSNHGITKMRGQFFEYENEYLDSNVNITAIFHPSYLLRSPGQKRLAWRDLLMIQDYIDHNGIRV